MTRATDGGASGDRVVLLDVDGTLVDTNHLHVLAWQRALREVAALEVPSWLLHRMVGKGGDRYVAAVAGEEVERRCGDAVREGHGRHYDALLPEVRPFDGARDLIEALRARGLKVVLASSGKAGEIDHYLDLLDARPLLDGWTTSDDVAASKPAPDLLEAARAQVSAHAALLVGDTVWDGAAAAHAGVPFVGLRCGGVCAAELRDAGAVAVFDGPRDLRAHLDEALKASRNG